MTIPVAEPGWTMWMVSHFHYDPVWWNTQAQYTDGLGRADRARLGAAGVPATGFDLVRPHLETARRDPDYKFVLAEIDYLKPYWDALPADRADLRGCSPRAGGARRRHLQRAEHQPHRAPSRRSATSSTAIGYQRDVLGGDPRDRLAARRVRARPAVPRAGGRRRADLVVVGARPVPPVGADRRPTAGYGDPRVMQFPSEFEWLSPTGAGCSPHYMPAHYSAGWRMDSPPTWPRPRQAVYELFRPLQPVAATRNVLLPVGTDHITAGQWVTEIHRDWNARYVWPRFVCALPREFFAAVRAELPRAAGAPVAADPRHEPGLHRQGRLLHRHQAGPAGRRGRVADAERLATLAALHGARFPHAAARQGLAAAGLRRPPRRDHRHRVRPGLPGPAGRLAGGARPPAAPCSTPPRRHLAVAGGHRRRPAPR